MTQKIKLTALIMLSLYSLTGCNSGGSTTRAPDVKPTYNLGDSAQLEMISSGCTGPTMVVSESSAFSQFSCNAESSTLNLSIKFNSQPSAYIEIPESNTLPANLALAINGATCTNSPSDTYSCNFNITASNTTTNSMIELPLNGSLGKEDFIVIKFE